MSITLRNTMTGKEWNFYTAAGLTALGTKVETRDGSAQVATFADFEPGLYTLINDGAEDVNVVLWGQTYTVASNSKWDFMAHSDVGSISPLMASSGNERYRGEPVTEPEPEPEPPADGNGTDTTAGGADSTPAAAAPNS